MSILKFSVSVRDFFCSDDRPRVGGADGSMDSFIISVKKCVWAKYWRYLGKKVGAHLWPADKILGAMVVMRGV